MRRTNSRALQGLILAAGTPLGWLLIRGMQGSSVQRELTANPGLYLYMSIGTAVVFGLFGFLLGTREARLLEANQRLEALTVTDSLTGLRNTRYFHTRLAEEHADAERTGMPLAVVIVDLDHFKRVNDQYGHLVGDDVLVNAARAIASITREGETEARVGGEEFGLLLPDSTGAEASDVAERVRRAIEATETQLPGGSGETIRITASAGVASTAEFPGASTQELLSAADEAMYGAKQAGRNRTVVAAS
jgi:diguanylate cyclase (GGDEF)-like protein